MNKLCERVKQSTVSLVVAGGLAGLVGCDKPDEILIHETTFEDGTKVKFIHEVEPLVGDNCRLECYNRNEKLTVYLRQPCFNFKKLRIVDDRGAFVFYDLDDKGYVSNKLKK